MQAAELVPCHCFDSPLIESCILPKCSTFLWQPILTKSSHCPQGKATYVFNLTIVTHVLISTQSCDLLIKLTKLWPFYNIMCLISLPLWRSPDYDNKGRLNSSFSAWPNTVHSDIKSKTLEGESFRTTGLWSFCKCAIGTLGRLYYLDISRTQ